MPDEKFMGLPKRLELAVGAPVLLLHNLAVEHGLVNGAQGVIRDICYNVDSHPTHERRERRMPCAIIVDFHKYTGPGFIADAPQHLGSPHAPYTRRWRWRRDF